MLFFYRKLKEKNFDLTLKVQHLESVNASLLSDLERVTLEAEIFKRELDSLKENKELIKINREILELEREKDRMALKMQVEAMREEMMTKEM